jgi:hypothetical protein
MQETKEEASLCVASSRNVLNAATAPPKECPAGMFWMYQFGGFCQPGKTLQPRTILLARQDSHDYDLCSAPDSTR